MENDSDKNVKLKYQNEKLQIKIKNVVDNFKILHCHFNL